LHNRSIGKSSKFIKNPVIYVKKLIIMLIQFKFGHNDQNGSILSQKMPKFELYKHDEFFNIYYRIFYELWTFAYFDRLCKLEKRGDEIKNKSSPLKLLSQSQTNFAEMILVWSPFRGEDLFLISSPLFSNLHNRSKEAKVQSS
jgi:hypothetical protein